MKTTPHSMISVGKSLNGGRHCDTEFLGYFRSHNEVEPGDFLHGHVGGLTTSEDAVDVLGPHRACRDVVGV
jgi:hypothetical protein